MAVLYVIERDEVDEYKSKFKNRHVTLSERDIENLKNNKVLCVNSGDLSIFIDFETEDKWQV
ncbi:MAG: hypothetical protein R3Y12_04210 [Clostridia bacterium]